MCHDVVGPAGQGLPEGATVILHVCVCVFSLILSLLVYTRHLLTQEHTFTYIHMHTHTHTYIHTYVHTYTRHLLTWTKNSICSLPPSNSDGDGDDGGGEEKEEEEVVMVIVTEVIRRRF
jgi:hypothetical protein